MSKKNSGTWRFWRFILQNMSSSLTIVAAVLALLLAQLGVISPSVLPGITISLLALIAVSQLIDSRRTLTALSEKIDTLTLELRSENRAVHLRRFETIDDAIQYLTKRTRASRFSVLQASIDKQRARPIQARLAYEKAREDLIISDRVKYRYIGVIDEKRHFKAVLNLLDRGPLHNFYVAFQRRPASDLPLMSFTVFDGEEVFTRAPYDMGADPVYISIKSLEIAQLFGSYFDTLWAHAEKVEKAETLRAMLWNLENQKE